MVLDTVQYVQYIGGEAGCILFGVETFKSSCIIFRMTILDPAG